MTHSKTWTGVITWTPLIACGMPFLLAFSVGDSSEHFSLEAFEFFLFVYIVRIAIPALIYRAAPSQRTQGMLVDAFRASIAFEILLIVSAIYQILTYKNDQGLDGLGIVFAIAAIGGASLIAQLLGMIVGFVRHSKGRA